MRKIFVLPLLILSLLLFSCETTVSINYLQPSDVDMGMYRNLAIMPVRVENSAYYAPIYVPNRTTDVRYGNIRSSYDSASSSRIALYATDQLYTTLSASNYLNVLSPERTESIVSSYPSRVKAYQALKEQGYDAVLVPIITRMSVDEYVYAVSNYERVYNDRTKRYSYNYVPEYYLNQTLEIVYKFYLYETEGASLVSTKTFQDSREKTISLDGPSRGGLSNIDSYFESMIKSFNEGIYQIYSVGEKTYDVKLMSNSPKNKKAEEAYSLVKQGENEKALEIFYQVYLEEGHAPSGYNAAILFAEQGDFEKAEEVIKNVEGVLSNSKVQTLSAAISIMRERTEAAIREGGEL